MPTMKKMDADNIFNIYKPVGISPLDAIKLLKEKYPELKGKKMTYAGRLDPMAEGVLLILAGKAVYGKEKYLKLDKEYEGEILFGFNTDTYDVLGLPKSVRQPALTSRTVLDGIIKKFEGEIFLPLPPYSSYKIKGKPLFRWAREGKLGEIEIPIRQTKINSAKLLGITEISGKNLMKIIKQKISLIKGDFRQKEILNQWQKILNKNKLKYQIAKIKIACSSGTYIRSIAHRLGKELKTGATILSLTRAKVGDFDIKDSQKFKNNKNYILSAIANIP